jgi:hypothetical protein
MGFWRSGQNINSITFNGVALTRIAQSAASNGDDRGEIWKLAAHAAATANIVASYSGTGVSGTMVATNVTGQDVTVPEGTAASKVDTAQGTSTGSLAITGTDTGDLTIVVFAGGTATPTTPSATGGGPAVEDFDGASNGEETTTWSASGTVTAVSATFTIKDWAILAIPLKAEIPQIAVPASDASTGSWTATPLYPNIDETTADDSNYITSSPNPTSDVCEVAFGTLNDPSLSTGHIIYYRYRKAGNAGKQVDLQVDLVQGTTIIATWTHTDIGVGINQASQTLTGTQADSITDYTDLRLRFTANTP